MEKFYLGLDIGTDSVGIACTDENYNLLRAKGKDAWAVRLFDEASDASSRRTKRAARRRLQRRAQRIDLLQGLFAPMMDDSLFFLRLNNSGFCFEDKNEKLGSEFSLFADDGLTDKDFYKKYPTVFHLRKDLIEGKQKSDLRFYYLAIHHIVKYRGHFLLQGENMRDIADLGKLFAELNGVCEEAFDEPPSFDVHKAAAFKEIATDNQWGIKDKTKKIDELFGNMASTQKAIVRMLLGGKGSPCDVFGKEEYKEIKSFSFKNYTDEEFFALSDEIDDCDYTVLEKMRGIYGYLVFERVLNGHEYISDAMTDIYNKHRSDLEKLKKLLRDSGLRDAYNLIFKRICAESQDNKDKKPINNYVRYIGYTKIGKKKIRVEKIKQKDIGSFYAFIKKVLTDNAEKIKDKAALEDILNELESENCNFLPKILNADNGTFPHQINGVELDAILNNLCRDYPSFEAVDDSGYSAKEKIRKIFEFRIPYYVGPLNTYHSDKGGNSWMVRKAEGKITPWNFDDMVDKAESNERFMRRMTNKCTYLTGEDVLPKCSVIYQKFTVLNQINKLKIDERPISVQLKQDIFNDLFLKDKKVTKKKVKAYLLSRGKITREEAETVTLSGIDEEFTCSMSSYISLKNILGDVVDKLPNAVEDIILWHTLNTDKSVVEGLIDRKYGDVTEIMNNKKRLNGLTFKDFGRLSRAFLCETYGGGDPVTGEAYTVLGELYNTNLNLNELLFSEKYSFRDAIAERNGELDEEVTYKNVEELYVSPKLRRGIWQAMQMTDEYVQAIGRAPDKIFIEVTRGDGEKKRTSSRKNKLLDLYKELGKTAKDITDLADELKGKTDMQLRQERLYLYFLQCGKCAYTGKKISLDSLSDDVYDIDHIVPRSLTKDDSIDNKVLVLREKNAQKTDEYPLPAGFTDMQGEWKKWRDKGLMSEKKYALLTRRDPLTADDFNGFINRQLVETNQMCDAVAKLLERKYSYGGTKIVYSKAANVSDFRQQFDIVKCRDTNDFHHARDAYLNIAVGNVYDTRFSSPRDYYYSKNDADGGELRQYNLRKIFTNWNTAGAWDKKTSIETVKNTCSKTSITVTRYAFVEHGQFYDETVYPKTDGTDKDTRARKSLDAPRKAYLPAEKYGGYSSLKTAYFAVVESLDKKGKVIKTIERVTVLLDYSAHGDESRLLEYFEKTVGLNSPKLLVPKIKTKALLSVNGSFAWIAGVSGNRILLHNAVQWYTDAKTDKYIKAIGKLLDMKSKGIIDEKDASEEFPMTANKNADTLKINKKQNLELYDRITDKLSAKVYSGISAFGNVRKQLLKKREVFCGLSTLNQSITLSKIAKFMRCNAELADLSLLGESASSGKLLISKDVTDCDIRIIDQSPCGLTVKERRV